MFVSYCILTSYFELKCHKENKVSWGKKFNNLMKVKKKNLFDEIISWTKDVSGSNFILCLTLMPIFDLKLWHKI